MRRGWLGRMVRVQQQPVAPEGTVLIEYGCEKGGQVITYYPTEAAMLNDPIYGRSEGAMSVGRILKADGYGGWVISSKWRPVFLGELATFRYDQFRSD